MFEAYNEYVILFGWGSFGTWDAEHHAHPSTTPQTPNQTNTHNRQTTYRLAHERSPPAVVAAEVAAALAPSPPLLLLRPRPLVMVVVGVGREEGGKEGGDALGKGVREAFLLLLYRCCVFTWLLVLVGCWGLALRVCVC